MIIKYVKRKFKSNGPSLSIRLRKLRELSMCNKQEIGLGCTLVWFNRESTNSFTSDYVINNNRKKVHINNLPKHLAKVLPNNYLNASNEKWVTFLKTAFPSILD